MTKLSLLPEVNTCAKYDDWKGNVAADDIDDCNRRLHHYLRTKKVIGEDDFIVSVSCSYTDVHGCTENLTVSVTVRTVKLGNHENVKQAIDSDVEVPVQDIHVDIPLEEFFTCFKRFNITFSPKGLFD